MLLNALYEDASFVFDDSSKITSSDAIGEAIFKSRANCSVDLSAKPMIKFYKNRLCSENFEQVIQFLLFAVNYLAENLTKN